MKNCVKKGFVLAFALLLCVGLVPASVSAATKSPGVSYQTQIENIGWEADAGIGIKSNGDTSGTSGRSLRLEGIKINLDSQGYDLGVSYQTHIQDIGWEADAGRGWKSNGVMSGTQGESKRLEAIQIKLTGTDADKFDIYYQVHAQNYGWLDWAKNGESAGTAGLSLRLEAIRIVILPKGSEAPGSTESSYISADAFLSTIKGDWHDETNNISLKIGAPNTDAGLLWLGAKWYEYRYHITDINRNGKSGTVEAYKMNYYKFTSGGHEKIEIDVNPPDVYTYSFENNTITKYKHTGDNVQTTIYTRQ
ncbi:hypothetical protein [Acetobacterium tundrae]|uniref:Uncharacterized protein n=1 Tax=Acetobacterium tundrae TaxID=132932 RepID=A0ABR6WL46_9FIRM|nr:hypothetical protein [Acetobacterium tundrae]MBC3797152.1 hypothetical protein [Acetobacterium tundrae]